MRQTEIRKELDSIWKYIHRIELVLNIKNKVEKEVDKQIVKELDNPQEKYEQSVTIKGLPNTKDQNKNSSESRHKDDSGVVTTESVDGKSPVDILDETKDELVKAVADKVNNPKLKK